VRIRACSEEVLKKRRRKRNLEEEEEEEGFVSPDLSALFLAALFSAPSTFSTVARCTS
jgi:hypothetical protein